MIPPAKALYTILDHVRPLPFENTELTESIGRIIAEDIYALEDLPSFDNSAMDGYAVRSDDLNGASRERPAKLKIREVIRAGALAKQELKFGEAMKIMTGASTYWVGYCCYERNDRNRQ